MSWEQTSKHLEALASEFVRLLSGELSDLNQPQSHNRTPLRHHLFSLVSQLQPSCDALRQERISPHFPPRQALQ